MPGKPLDSVYFISIPEQFSLSLGDFSVDPAILLPVELQSPAEKLDVSSISWEMIVSGMLRVITFSPEHENADYYRRFVLAVKPDIESELVRAGIEKARHHDYDLAEELFVTAAAVNPESLASWFNRAQVYESRARSYQQLGNDSLCQTFLEKTRLAYEAALNIEPRSVQALRSAGEFYLRIGNHEKALITFKELAEQEDSTRVREIIEELTTRKRLDAKFQEAYAAILDGREEDAIRFIDNFLAESDATWTAWFLRGWALRRMGNYAEAEKNFRTALDLSEPQTDILNELAICTMENGNFDESRGFLEKALELEPENVKILSNMGIIALKQGNPSESENHFRKVLEIDPKDPIALNFLNYLDS
ncbi:tetratricopeptide repeat protein [Marispirochaeta aestuarii]|uniref:tetratricopeptide repeat protein n=1 Tax=Marispirochaeta aestuarii TaxID=1963862 RepID=UPI0029C6885D|nr:tetratricopeptide repeat protein [Marispirochaeta aestuarii]